MYKLVKDSHNKRKEQDRNINDAYQQTQKDAILNYEKQKLLSNLNN